MVLSMHSPACDRPSIKRLTLLFSLFLLPPTCPPPPIAGPLQDSQAGMGSCWPPLTLSFFFVYPSLQRNSAKKEEHS